MVYKGHLYKGHMENLEEIKGHTICSTEKLRDKITYIFKKVDRMFSQRTEEFFLQYNFSGQTKFGG